MMRNGLRVIATAGLALTLMSCESVEGLSKENLGTALGAVAGAVIGSKVGGDNKTLAIALGAAGGAYLGKTIGRMLDERDQQRLAASTLETLRTGEEQSWHNPETGVTAKTSVKESSTQHQQLQVRVLKDKVKEIPPMELVGEEYSTGKSVNVRGGPGTNYVVVDKLAAGERIHVVGKVVDKPWYMISRGGVGGGFVYSNLLTAVPVEDWSIAETETPAPDSAVETVAVATTSDCRVVTQNITLKNGKSATEEVTACRGPNGWEIV
ncbi:hypothetical protein MNBD_GAMMA15-1112 [hydrothermal vent metagenome]|uniref:SH3b domain-containing protein n=1 Tax=hydrothermal vent metagenome TaxID=652676 RepID=A0A3B0YRG0_9ZZZZ